MIAKHIPMRSLGKSDFASLVDYITDEQEKTERLGQVRVTNCEAGTVQAAIDEVLATQHINTRAQSDKTYHLLLGFPLGEIPNAEILASIEDRICSGLGYGDHQRVSAVHHDTDHLHIHIAINKIHPTRNTIHEPFQAYRTLGELCTKLEREYGLQRVNHEPRRRLSESRAGDMEQHSGIESLVSWIKRECLDELKDAQTWTELHQIIRENGLELRERANGFIIAAGDGTMVKASTVSRELSKPKLEARLGSFEASPEWKTQTKTRRIYQKDPIRMRIKTVELYARYTAEQKSLTAVRAEALAKAKRRKDRAIEDAKRSNRLRRAAIKIVDGKGIDKRVLYSQASASLRTTLRTIHQDYSNERERLYKGFKRKTWADWLRLEAVKGDDEALAALRSREASQGLKGNTFRAEGQAKPGHAPVLDNITKKGTIIFRVGLSVVRDDGDKLQVSREASREGLQAALRFAIEKYGERITVNGTAEFKAQIVRAAVDINLPITFADPGLERRRQELLTKEKAYERPKLQFDRGRTDRRGIGCAGSRAVADQHVTGSSSTRPEPGYSRTARATDGSAEFNRKPDIGRPGRKPPPQSQNRLRTLSSLGVVRIASGSEVLLPGDVPGHMEQQRTQPDNTLRRSVFGPRVKPDQITAANKYIGEREKMRLNIFDIQKHSLYNGQNGDFYYGGTRNVDGHVLALLKYGDEVVVLPIDQATARRLKRVGVGDPVTITAAGSIKTSKGRSQ
ncbi:TraI/MobA(P) family conjugative relaxase [Methylomicrobium sp. Wu6]|uniref:TraI/MobA(P) family conjugative relaxase n=1 Tax=Methylomicrobium sp. Wu6 TaxID=3107928 RepID=UPI002DD6550F|nr:TraI/MobA(P) family conjugative relaxase [Methylomicrobium sp. Wu6]MEC4748594.1 TraI/MobA(P) family conjugative relaxase [Methylomicrobium sp. Wu6]